MVFRHGNKIMSRVWSDPRKTTIHDIKFIDDTVIVCTDGITVLSETVAVVSEETWDVLVETVPPRPEKTDNGFEAFMTEMVGIAEDSEVSVSAVELSYGAWCEIRGIAPTARASRKTIVKMLCECGAKAVVVDGRVIARGITLRERSTG